MKKMAVLGLLLLLALSSIPLAFADLTGYTKAPYLTSWELSFNYPWRYRNVGIGNRWFLRPTITNVGTFDLSDAKVRIIIAKIWILDGDVWTGPFSDGPTIDANCKVSNAEKIAAKTYLVSLGTVKVDVTKKILLNVWTSDGVAFQFFVSVWYLA